MKEFDCRSAHAVEAAHRRELMENPSNHPQDTKTMIGGVMKETGSGMVTNARSIINLTTGAVRTRKAGQKAKESTRPRTSQKTRAAHNQEASGNGSLRIPRH